LNSIVSGFPLQTVAKEKSRAPQGFSPEG